jgi:hypothetical protein
LQFSSGDQLADIVVELLPAFAFKLNHRRQHGSKKQESLIKTESYLRFVAVGMDVGMLQMVAIISTYFQCLMEQMSCRPGHQPTLLRSFGRRAITVPSCEAAQVARCSLGGAGQINTPAEAGARSRRFPI